MGLDTVELLMSFERYFSLEIPDATAETIYTVGDLAAWLSQQLGVAGLRQSAVREMIAKQLLSELPPGSAEATSLRQVLPAAQVLEGYRDALQKRYGLMLPPLAAPLPPLRYAFTMGAPNWSAAT
jgi:hypothetical protein